MEKIIRQRLTESAATLSAIPETQTQTIIAMVDIIVKSLKTGGKLILMGNGGSAADAQHLAAEFVGRFQHERAAIPAIALSVNTSILTAIGNDYGYENIFARQIEALATDKDVVLGISTSGTSPNIIKAIKKARIKESLCLGFTGQNGNMLEEICDQCLKVPSTITARIQEGHISVGHIICELVEEAFK